MYRKIILFLGAAAIIASLMMPPTYTYTVDTGKVSSWSGQPVMSTVTGTNYPQLTIRTLAIFIGAGALFFITTSPNKE